MAISLEDFQKAWQRTRISTQRVAVAEILRGLKAYLTENKGQPQLQVVYFALSNSADTVIADAACVLHALVYDKPNASTTAAWLQGSNHASAMQASEDFNIPLSASAKATKPIILTFPDGLPLSAGLVIISATTAAGGTRSATADCGTGFAILGAP